MGGDDVTVAKGIAALNVVGQGGGGEIAGGLKLKQQAGGDGGSAPVWQIMSYYLFSV